MGAAPEEAFDRWTSLAVRSVGTPAGFIAFLDDRVHRVKGVVGVEGFQSGSSFPVEQSASRLVVTLGRTLAVTDVRDEPLLEGAAALHRAGLRSFLGAPVRVEGFDVGAICVAAYQPREWTADEQALLTDFAAAIASEVLLRLSSAEAAHSNQVVASHNRIHELIARDAPLQEVLAEVVFSIERYDPALLGSIMLLDQDDRTTMRHGASPSLPASYTDAIDGIQAGPRVGSCGTAAYLGIEVVSRDIETDARWAPYRELTRSCDLRHCWSFPIFGAAGDVLGTFGVYGRQPRTPSPEHLGFLRDAAHVAGIAIERRRTTEALVHRATHDPLTDLPDRALADERLTAALEVSRRSGDPVAVLFVDLDRLRVVNAGLGHQAGDRIIRHAAQRLGGCLAPGDIAARVGGDEFVVVAPQRCQESAEQLADEIVAAIAEPVADGVAEGFVTTASVGVAVVYGDEVDAREAIRRADDAMFVAKADGGNRHQRGGHGGAGSPGRRLQLEAALRGALGRGEFHVVAQPIICLQDGRVESLETLLRWTHPQLGPVPPDEFIPLAEQAGLIDELGGWVLREALRHAAPLQAAARERLYVTVNVSPLQLRRRDFPDTVAAALSEAGAHPRGLVLEITETALLGDDPVTLQALEELRGLGVWIVVDDFGTGYSSLSMLKGDTIDGIKIDRSFIAGLPGDASSASIVAGVSNMARGLGRRVVAEGIETAEQLEFVRNLGCDLAQGYLLGRPVPFAELVLEPGELRRAA